MRRLCLFAVAELAASASTLALIAGHELLGMLAGAGRHSSTITNLQFELGEGPCLEVYASGIAVPMRAHADIIGALNLFRGSDRPFSDAELEIARAMAQVATIALIQERAIREGSLLAEQLQAALRSRVVIEQAKGMLAEHLSTTVDEAFQLLNRYARDNNRRLTDVARDIVDRKVPHDALARRPGTA